MRYLVRSFNYNDTEKPDWLVINKTHRPMHAAINPVTSTVPGRRGSWFFDTQTDSKEIKFDVEIMGADDMDLWQKIEWLTGWLDRGEELPLRINDEPDRYYMAVYTGGGDAIEQIAAIGSGTLTFFCPDPYKYGTHFNYDLNDGTTTTVINYTGTAPMHPKITVDFTQDSNYFAFIGPEGFVQFGEPAAIDGQVVTPRDRIFVDQMTDLAPWSASGINVDFGQAAGTFRVQDGHKFVVNDWGDDESTVGIWHGPVVKRSLPKPVKDFRAIFDIDLNNPPNTAGRVEMWLLDAAGAILARLIFWDRSLNAQKNEVAVTAGPNSNQKIILQHEGFSYSRSLTWNGSFLGRIVLNRQGNVWRASIAKLLAGNRFSTASAAYGKVTHGANLADVAQIQIGIRKYGNSPSFYAAIRDIGVEELNTVPAGAAETIFQAGDQLEIDFAQGAAFLNGEYFNEYLDPASRFFPIMPGISEVQARATQPDGFTINIDYDQRYK